MIVETVQRLVAATNADGETTVLHLRLFGRMEALTRSGDSVLPTGRKTRALLAVMAFSAPQVMPRDQLARLLWSRRPEDHARASLRQEIHRLQEALAPLGVPVLAINRDSLALRQGLVWADATEALGPSGAQQPACLALLDGNLVPELDGIDPELDGWLASRREMLRQRGRQIAESFLRELPPANEAVAVGQRLLAVDRAHEGAWRALIRAYVADGEYAMAIQTYQRCRSALADLLDTVPSPETQRLVEEIRTAPYHPAKMHPSVGKRNNAALSEKPLARAPMNCGIAGQARVWLRVIPPRLVGDGGEDNGFADAFGDELIGALAPFRWPSATCVGDLSPASFLLTGSIQRDNERARIALHLVDTRGGNEVAWAQTFELLWRRLLSGQKLVVAQAAAQVDAKLLHLLAQRAACLPVEDLGPDDLILGALPLIGRLDRVCFMQAGTRLARAVTMAPDFAETHAWYAYWHLLLLAQGWAGDVAAMATRASDLATHALGLDEQDPRVLTIAGHVQAQLSGNAAAAVSLHQRAVGINPNLPMSWAFAAAAHACTGDLSKAANCAARYKSLAAMGPHGFLLETSLTLVHLLRHEHSMALAVGRAVTATNPGFVEGYKGYLAVLGHLDLAREAAAAREKLLRLEPDFSLAKFAAACPLERAADRKHYIAGLRRAGVPE